MRYSQGQKEKTGAYVKFRSSRAFRPEASTPAVLGHLKTYHKIEGKSTLSRKI
jgi:hypothetical protein